MEYIALAIALVSLVLAVFLAVKLKRLSDSVASYKKETAASIKAVKQSIGEIEATPISVEGLPIEYDKQNNTITISANLEAKGYVCANTRM